LCANLAVADRGAAVPVPHPIPDSLAEVIADRFRLLADPTRIRILDRLRDGELTVQEITAQLGTSQQNVSKHLGQLLRAGIVAREKDGNFARYRILDQAVFELCEHVCGGLERQLDEMRALLGEEAAR
jgi:DNA-binding transcriptional ArsR family regulator